MLAAVDFVAQDVFETLAPARDLVAVSIGDPAQAPPANLAGFSNALRLEFLDCDQHDVEHQGVPEAVLCSLAQMDQLIEFVRARHAAPEVLRLVVHCRMGSSRSAAAALVAHHLTQCTFPRHPDAHHANSHIVGLAARALGADIAVPRKSTDGEPHAYLPQQLQI